MTKKIIGSLSFKMLLTLLLVTAMFFSMPSRINAQSAGAQEEIFVVADEMPTFPGGPKALMDFIYKRVSYPADAMDKGIEGKVIVRFAINKEGKVTQPSISKGLYPSIDKAVLEVIPKIPNFVPGKIGGKPVSVWYAVPITFKIQQ